MSDGTDVSVPGPRPSVTIYDVAETLVPGVCFECGSPAEHRHHVVPAFRGGTRCVWLCETCHEKVHGTDKGQFGAMRAARREVSLRGEFVGGHRYHRRYGVEVVVVNGKSCYKPVPGEQEVIRRICAECPNGAGYDRMAKLLTAEGVPTVAGVAWKAKVVRDLALRGPDTNLSDYLGARPWES